MEYAKTPRHNKVRHNVIAPMPDDVKRRVVPPFAQWIDESRGGNKWGDDFDNGNVKLSRKNAFPHLPQPTKHNVSVNNINLTTSTIISEKDGVQIVEEEELKHDALPGNLNGEQEAKEMNDASSASSKKTYSQHSLLSTDVDTSSVDATYRSRETYTSSSGSNNNYLIGGVGMGLAMGIGGIRVPGIEMLHFNQRSGSSNNLETLERLAEASGHRKGSILKNSNSNYDIFASPKSHGSARLIREDERRVSWSDLHHGKELTQVREVEYGESKLHRIMRQNRSSVIVTVALFIFSMVAIAVVLAAVKLS